jgi:hypothetical protein
MEKPGGTDPSGVGSSPLGLARTCPRRSEMRRPQGKERLGRPSQPLKKLAGDSEDLDGKHLCSSSYFLWMFLFW